MPEQLTRDEQWTKLKHWIAENITAIEADDLSRLPDTFTGERGEAAIDAYKTCLEAMRYLEEWDKFGLEPKSEA